MVKIPYIKIPSVRVGSIVPTSNIGTGGATPAPPTPITYLTQWKMLGNSQVHTDPYLTQWKVSGNSQIQQYLTQWKVEGNSVVDNNAILSCGDLGQDNKYHVKISDGVNVFDIALTEPLRMVSGVADSIEFANGTAVVTRNIASTTWNELTVIKDNQVSNYDRFRTDSLSSVILLPVSTVQSRTDKCLSADFVQDTAPINKGTDVDQCMAAYNTGALYIRDTSVSNATEFQAKYGTHELYYRLATPITETIQAPQIAVSSTYTSANDVAHSSFTYANPLIYSCGDYSDVDGKYHVKISNGATIYDIPLTEPLRKVNDVADTIEFANGVATVTRNIGSSIMSNLNWGIGIYSPTGKYRFFTNSLTAIAKGSAGNDKVGNLLCPIYNTVTAFDTAQTLITGISVVINQGYIYLYDENYNTSSSKNDFLAHIDGAELIYELATPTTEVIQVSPFPISPTDTYTSANGTPYSAFEYKKNVEIWSCGEYSEVDGKYHILVQPQGGSIADIALDAPLRKVNDVADSIEFANGAAVVTRNLGFIDNIYNLTWRIAATNVSNKYRIVSQKLNPAPVPITIDNSVSLMSGLYTEKQTYNAITGYTITSEGYLALYDGDYNTPDDLNAFKEHINGLQFLYKKETPTTETIQVPQIEEADSYTCVISQGGKAVSWSSFETE